MSPNERNELACHPRMTRADIVSQRTIFVGTRFSPVMTDLGRRAEMTIEFTAFDQPRRIEEQIAVPVIILAIHH